MSLRSCLHTRRKREGYTPGPWECGNIPFPTVPSRPPFYCSWFTTLLDNCPMAQLLGATAHQLSRGKSPFGWVMGEMAVDKRGKRSEKCNYAIPFSSHGRTNSRLELQYSMGSSKFHFLSSPQISLPKTVHGRWKL
jgi:hypothetical protein